MVSSNNENAVQADIMFVIEGTAISGAYLNDLKSNYLIPTLEYFSQGTIEDRDYVCESTSTLYGLVVYHATDIMPRPSSDCYGPYSSPQRLLTTLDKLELVGGKGESHANIAEGLATALQAFEDLQRKRDGTNLMTQKHCILVCNSPPYQMPVMESSIYMGNTADQLAALLNERNINLSILSPRKLPAMFKLFEKAGGDLSLAQNKNYAKDPRHLVLLRGFSLKERPLSPTAAAPNSNLPLPSLPSPAGGAGSPLGGFRSQQQPQQAPPQPQPQAQQQPSQRPFVQQPQPGPPGYPGQLRPPNQTGSGPGAPRWPMPPPVATPVMMNQQRFGGPQGVAPGQGSALIAQLTQPVSAAGTPSGAYGGQINQQLNPMHQQIRMAGMNMNMVNQQMNAMPQQQNMVQNQQGMMQSNMMAQQAQMQPGPAQTPQPNPNPMQQQMNPQQQQQPQGNVQPPQTSQGPTPVIRERHTIWQGVLEWIEKGKVPNDQQKITKQVPCQVSITPDTESDLKAESWPPKLIMQLMPKQLIGNIGGAYLKNSTSVLFHPQPCEALESLTRVMSTGFAGCVHFTSVTSPNNCDIKVLILLYTVEKKAYLGFIPNDQVAFVDRLRKVIQHQKTTQLIRQGQVTGSTTGPGPSNGMPGDVTGQQQQQGNMMMLQTNPMAMSSGQMQQADNQVMQSVPMQMQQQQPSTVVNSAAGPSGPRPGLMQQQQQQQSQQPQQQPQQRPPFNQIEAARQQNLAKIQQLQQTLEAAQQQEMQYKNQLEIINHMKIQQIQQNLEQAQQQEVHFQAQMEQEQRQQLRAQLQQMQQQQQQRQMAPQQMQQQQQPTAQQQQQQQQQRMLRPQMGGNNPGLRHLLQQQQPQFRQNMGPGMTRPPNQQGQQQFDDVSNYDFMN